MQSRTDAVPVRSGSSGSAKRIAALLDATCRVESAASLAMKVPAGQLRNSGVDVVPHIPAIPVAAWRLHPVRRTIRPHHGARCCRRTVWAQPGEVHGSASRTAVAEL